MRKASIKRDLAYKQGMLIGITYACDEIDKLICESHSHTENEKLWRLRDIMRSYQADLRDEIEKKEYKIIKKIGYSRKGSRSANE